MARQIVIVAALIFALCPFVVFSKEKPKDKIAQLDSLQSLWSFYKFNYIESGKVISRDEKGITTSEGQSYAMLRAVWADDRDVFDSVWVWTKTNLKRQEDHLFAWKYKGKILDPNSASDADVDIALALVLAARKFDDAKYLEDARPLLKDIWEKEVIPVGDNFILVGGNWAKDEKFPTIHTGYLAPYAYQEFSKVDGSRPWEKLVDGSYMLWNWIFESEKLSVPPIKVYLNVDSGSFQLKPPDIVKKNFWGRSKVISKKPHNFGYDAYPMYWRAAVDAKWNHRDQAPLRKKMLAFFKEEWKSRKRILDNYNLEGKALSKLEGLPLYATLHSLALIEDVEFARDLETYVLDSLFQKALIGQQTPYYLHNWIWFSKAFELQKVRHFNEFLAFLYPFDVKGFLNHFPVFLFWLSFILFFLQKYVSFPYARYFHMAFLVCAFLVCLRYMLWRLFSSLNFIETFGPLISIGLWIAEFYCFTTVIFLLVQVGFKNNFRRQKPKTQNYFPSVDIFIPIYSEPLDILEKTVVAALNMDYPNKTVYVCDDSHKDEVRELTQKLGAVYIKGPKKHAKAGNLNNAMTKSQGELIVVFDTDHIPLNNFLKETVAHFSNEKLGILQTPHHFFNQDIFQRCLKLPEMVPNEADQFNHGVQSARDAWGGSFFVGSGAVFRRKAMEEIGGFKLMSITEDIHTSMYIHSKGWESAFVNKDLAVGLTAENLSSYIIQRQRWMQGCLQIFFKDNPLFKKGLNWRLRLGYFGSLYYFFFPLPKIVFWATPLFYLFFHWHPIFSEVSVLLGYLVPYMLILPLITASLIPRWPRALFGSLYENIIFIPLFLSLFEMLLPKSLGFKVTPKGIRSEKRKFDWASSKWTLIAIGISLFGIAKGLFEFYYFDIEKDAYFFNISWALYNLLFLAASVIIAWERPQKRDEERIKFSLPLKLKDSEGNEIQGTLVDISLSGANIKIPKSEVSPKDVTLIFPDNWDLKIKAQKIHTSTNGIWVKKEGFRFSDLEAQQRHKLLLNSFANPECWDDIHKKHTQNNLVLAACFFIGLVKGFFPDKKSIEVK